MTDYFTGIESLSLYCCLLPSIVIIIWLSFFLYFKKKKDLNPNLKSFIKISLPLLIIGNIVASFGLINISIGTHYNTIEISPGESWEVNGYLSEGDVIEIRFTSDYPKFTIYLNREYIYKHVTCDEIDSYEEIRTESLKTYDIDSISDIINFVVQTEGDYSIIFFNSNQITTVKIETYVKFKDNVDEGFLIGGWIISLIGVVIIILIKNKKKIFF